VIVRRIRRALSGLFLWFVARVAMRRLTVKRKPLLRWRERIVIQLSMFLPLMLGGKRLGSRSAWVLLATLIACLASTELIELLRRRRAVRVLNEVFE